MRDTWYARPPLHRICGRVQNPPDHASRGSFGKVRNFLPNDTKKKSLTQFRRFTDLLDFSGDVSNWKVQKGHHREKIKKSEATFWRWVRRKPRTAWNASSNDTFCTPEIMYLTLERTLPPPNYLNLINFVKFADEIRDSIIVIGQSGVTVERRNFF